MIHKICPICGGKLSEILPTKEDRNVNHKVLICDDEIDHKFWVSEYESDCLRWNPGTNFEDILYFRKFKNTNRELVRDLALKELKDMVNSEDHRLKTLDFEDDTEFFGSQTIQKTYDKTPEYTEIFDAKVQENLLSIIQSQNLTIKQLIEEYGKMEKYADDLQDKVDNLMKSKNVTPSGIILKL